MLYCLEMLEEVGIATTPGSGFGQKDGTFHFRTTILPPEDKLQQFCDDIKKFHLHFLAKYAEDPGQTEVDMGGFALGGSRL